MKNLFILRHAHTDNNYIDDYNRQLTEKGIAQCKKTAANLSPYIVDIDMILCSSSVRTVQTVKNILIDLDINDIKTEYNKDLYHVSLNQLFQYLNNIDNRYHNILLVNHNPTISQLGIYFTPNYSPLYIDMLQGFDPGSLAMFSCDIKSWSDLSTEKIQLKKFWR